jgi:hypothetical protein
VNETQKREIMGKALALLVPIDWPEPFGIVFIEALACGTPVLTCPCGSVPELLRDGETGYIRRTPEQLAAVALRVREAISRHHCREYAKTHFDNARMANEYVRIYEKVLRHHNRLARALAAEFEVASDDAAIALLPELHGTELGPAPNVDLIAPHLGVPAEFSLDEDESVLMP